MYASRHLCELPDDPTAVPAATSWWDAAPAAISLSLRERGQAHTPSRAARVVNYSGSKQLLVQAHEQARLVQSQAMQAFRDKGPIRLSDLTDSVILSDGELDALLSVFDRLLCVGEDDDGARVCRSSDGRYVLRLVSPPNLHIRPARVRTKRGLLTVPDFELTIATSAQGMPTDDLDLVEGVVA